MKSAIVITLIIGVVTMMISSDIMAWETGFRGWLGKWCAVISMACFMAGIGMITYRLILGIWGMM